MEQYRTEEEQIEAIKKWFRDNGASTALAILVAVAAIFGWRAWDDHVREKGEAASALYYEVMEADQLVASGKTDGVERSTLERAVTELKDEYKNSIYAVFGALTLARVAVDAGELDRAEAELRWVRSHADDPSLAAIAGFRLTKLLLALGRIDEAKSLIEKMDASLHPATFEEIRGDVSLALGDKTTAREAYRSAMAAIEAEGGNRPLLKMKLEDLAAQQADQAGDEVAGIEK